MSKKITPPPYAGPSLESFLVAEKALMRTDGAGILYGEIVERRGDLALVRNARRIWEWEGAFTLSEVATNGLYPSPRTIIAEHKGLALVRWIEILECTDKAAKSIEKLPVRWAHDAEKANKYWEAFCAKNGSPVDCSHAGVGRSKEAPLIPLRGGAEYTTGEGKSIVPHYRPEHI